MKKEHLKVKGMDTEFVNFHYQEYDFFFARYDRTGLVDEKFRKEAKHLYIVYIFRKQRKLAKKGNRDMGSCALNIICFNKAYHTFDKMVHELFSILSEYILNTKEIFKCINKVLKLDPDN